MGWRHGRVSFPLVDGDFPAGWSDMDIICELAVDMRRCHSQMVWQAIQAVTAFATAVTALEAQVDVVESSSGFHFIGPDAGWFFDWKQRWREAGGK